MGGGWLGYSQKTNVSFKILRTSQRKTIEQNRSVSPVLASLTSVSETLTYHSRFQYIYIYIIYIDLDLICGNWTLSYRMDIPNAMCLLLYVNFTIQYPKMTTILVIMYGGPAVPLPHIRHLANKPISSPPARQHGMVQGKNT